MPCHLGPVILPSWLLLVLYFSPLVLAGSVAIHNDKPYFPIGIYHYPQGLPMDSKLEELANAGFNAVLSPLGTSLQFMDEAWEHGIGVIATLGWDMILTSDDDPKKEVLRSNIERLKDHPGLLGYEAPDEIAWVDFMDKQAGRYREGVLRGYAYIKSLDPDHPIWMNHAPRNELDYLRSYSEGGDILGTDIYPVPDGYGHSDLRQDLNCVAQYTEKLDQVGAGKPIYMVLQGFAWDQLPGHEHGRRPGTPTPQPSWTETRFMAYDAVCHGANGLIYWGMSYMKATDDLWFRLKRVASELRDLTPVLIDGPFQRMASAEPALEVFLKSHDGWRYLFALNTNKSRLESAEITLPTGWVDAASVLFEARSVQVEGGRLRDSFEPYDVHIYTDDPRADLSLVVAGPRVLAINRTASIRVAVANHGMLTAPAFDISMLLGSLEVARIAVEGLPAGGYREADIAWKPSVAGNISLRVVADASQMVDERTHTNNAEIFSVLVGPLGSELAPGRIWLEDQKSICIEARNLGPFPATDFNVSCSIGGVTLAEAIVPGLQAGGSAPICWTLPNLTGALPTVFGIDPSNEIGEMLEGNNQVSTVIYLVNLITEGPASYSRDLAPYGLWIIKYDPARGALPAESETCTLVWGLDGWQFPKDWPQDSRRVELVCESIMHRGPDGLWYVIIPSQTAGTLEFKFRDATCWGAAWDDNGGRGWRMVSREYASGILTELDRVLKNGSAYGADMSGYAQPLTLGWAAYLSQDYNLCLDLVANLTLPAGMDYVRQLLLYTSEEVETARALGIDVSLDERLIFIAGKMLERNNYLGAEGDLRRALEHIAFEKSKIPEIGFLALMVLACLSALWKLSAFPGRIVE